MPIPLLRDEFPLEEVYYPGEDGEPMAESDDQRDYLMYAVAALQEHFREREDLYVSGNLFIYYEEGNPKAVVAPDCFVVAGVPKHNRRIYKLWEEGKGPDFVLEITSKSTRSEDQGPKRGTYAYMGVTEYWQYDPTADYLDPPLKGYRLEQDAYTEIPRSYAFGSNLVLVSDVLGLELHLRADALRFRDPVAGNFLPSYGEAEAARRQAEERAAIEAERRQAVEKELAELQARLGSR